MMQFREIKFDSEEYFESVKLRDKILRKPLGIVFTEEFMKQDSGDFHIALFYEEKIRGILLFKPLDDKIVKMRQVAIDEGLQGKNFGTEMLEFSEKFAIERNYSRIILNARATVVNFYLRMNYKVIGEEFYEVGIPHFRRNRQNGW